jgi:SAM-dependent methyltransferase
MEEARRYHEWILSYFRPFLGARILEVGAGTGSFAERLHEAAPDSHLYLYEPAGNLYPSLEARFRGRPRVHVAHGSLQDAADSHCPDTIVMVNVLEHIQEDSSCLEQARAILQSSGHLLLFVPALQPIYGTMDRALEHFRRYGKKELSHKLRAAGFRILKIRYFNLIGVAAWGLYARVLKRVSISARDARFYTRWVVPPLEAIERWVEPPLGQSLLAVAQK